jgi:DNA repair exonuclease SbcCD ATPase subunit
MPNLQEVFNRMQETKDEQKVIKSVYREALDNSLQYQEVITRYKAVKEEKKKIEENIQTEYRSELSKLDAIKQDLETDKILMSDLALNELTSGHTVEIVDKYENKYEPLFSVKFKKIG